MALKTLLLVILGSLILATPLYAATAAGTASALEQDPLYRQVQNLCVKNDPALSLMKLQEKFIETSTMGLKQGVVSAFKRQIPLMADEATLREWQSTPFYLGLIDCFGNTPEGVTLTTAFVDELIVGYSIADGLGWGAVAMGAYKLLVYFSDLALTGAKTTALKIPWLKAFLDSNPNLLPRLQVVLKWGTRVGLVAYFTLDKHPLGEGQALLQPGEQTVSTPYQDADLKSEVQEVWDDGTFSPFMNGLLGTEEINGKTTRPCDPDLKIQGMINARLKVQSQQEMMQDAQFVSSLVGWIKDYGRQSDSACYNLYSNLMYDQLAKDVESQ